MNNVALITGADRGLGSGLTHALLESGWNVIAGQNLDWPELGELLELFPGKLTIVPLDVSSDASVLNAANEVKLYTSRIDLLICNAAINRSAHINSIRETQNYDDIQAEININAIGALRVVKAFLPLLEEGSLKRLCFVSSEAGSIADSRRTGWFGYCMSKAALNIAVKNLWNELSPQGFSFRLYHPGWMRTYMSGAKNLEAHLESDEAAKIALKYFLNCETSETLTLHDWNGNELPW
jgi:NAD(P)-dependent dehydrogenase (short-subunit alcohol dehydrogenase family)